MVDFCGPGNISLNKIIIIETIDNITRIRNSRLPLIITDVLNKNHNFACNCRKEASDTGGPAITHTTLASIPHHADM